MSGAVVLIQTGLNALGYDAGKADGVFGPRTKAAAAAWLLAGGKPKPGAQKPTLPLPRDLPWIAEALTVYGLHEIEDKAALSKWLKSDGKFLGDPQKLPWCGDAAHTAIGKALPDEPFPGPLGQNPYWARNWLFFGAATKPTAGCIAVFSRAGGGGHVGFIVGQDKTAFYVLGGNQGDRMSIVRIAKSRLLEGGTRWPYTFPARPISLPKMAAADIPTSINED